MKSTDLADAIKATEGVYVPIMQCLGGICTVLAVWNVYLILKHSTPEMDHYKWVLLNQTFLVSSFGILMGILWVPVPLFPVMCGYVRGPLAFLPERANLCVMSLLSAIVTSLTINLMYATVLRYTSIDQIKLYALLTTRDSAYIVIAFTLLCFAIAFIMNYLAGVSSNDLLDASKNEFPDLVPIFETEVVFGFSPTKNKGVYVYAVVSLTFFSAFGVVSSFVFYKLFSALKRHKATMSTRVFKLELSLFFAITMQFIIPIVFGVNPILLTIILVMLTTTNITVPSEVIFCMGNVHNVLFNLSTTFIIRPYRHVTVLWLRKIYWITVKRKTLTVSVSSEALSAKTQIVTRFRPSPPSQFTPVQ